MPHFFTVCTLQNSSTLSKGYLTLEHHLSVHVNLEVKSESSENVGPVSGCFDASETSPLLTAKSYLPLETYHITWVLFLGDHICDVCIILLL